MALVRSRQRVADHGEVFTPPELVDAMLGLLGSEPGRIDSRFLEPACGSGNFLVPVLRRKLATVAARYDDHDERRHRALVALRSIYGIELLADNVAECRQNLLETYVEGLGVIDEESLDAARVVLEANIVHGDALSMTTEGAGRRPITFADWSHAGTGAYTRRDVRLDALTPSTTPGADPRLVDLAERSGDRMRFDVVLGNPPYQLLDGGGTGSSAVPLYHRFIEQAIRLEPRLLTMVVPARWYSGGKGLDAFREAMLADRRIRHLADFPDSRDVFGEVDVAGGVCYFLWDRDNEGPCTVETHVGGNTFRSDRALDDFDVFVRDNRALGIVSKVRGRSSGSLATLVSPRNPFGIDAVDPGRTSGVFVFAAGADGYVGADAIVRNREWADRWKVLISKTTSEHAGQTDRSGRRRVLSRIETMPPGTACTGSYLVIGPFDTQLEAQNAADSLRTRFVRFLASTVLLTQNITRGSFQFVPRLDYTRAWDDETLYEEFGLDGQDVALIEASIRPLPPRNS